MENAALGVRNKKREEEETYEERKTIRIGKDRVLVVRLDVFVRVQELYLNRQLLSVLPTAVATFGN